LSGEINALDLPGGKMRPKLKTTNGEALVTYLSKETTLGLKTYTLENGGSLFMGLLAVWNILMFRYTTHKNIVIGTPVSGREHHDLEDQIGFYVNTLALRNDIDPHESFNSFFGKVKNNTLKSYQHQMYPFDRLVEDLNLQRDTSRNPIFDIMLTLQNVNGSQEIEELNPSEFVTIKQISTNKINFDIEVTFKEVGSYLSFQLNYNTDIYDRALAEELMTHYRQLLTQVLETPKEKIGYIDYLSKDEENTLISVFNDTCVDYPKHSSLAELFEKQVLSTPNNTAIRFGEVSLSYQALNEISNQFGNYLLDNYAIEPDDLIGVKLDRSDWLIISNLAVLKSGGAYVPIDPSYPQERIDYIENDTRCKVCIDFNELAKFNASRANCSKENIRAKVDGRNLAYILYTSGSTGKPKGVMIEQRSVTRLVKNTNYHSFSSQDHFLQVGAIGFDSTTFEFWGALLNGGSLTLCDSKVLLDPKLLKQEIIDNGINIALFATGWANQLIEFNIDVFDSLKTIVIGGDKMSSIHTALLKKTYPELVIVNAYGPTENATISTCYIVKEIPNSSDKIPIGVPISNSHVYLLDEMERLVPIGVVGEICLGGDGLARGYLNRPDLTDEKFITHPFIEGERLYKTGDLGRWLADGNMEFLGRKDDQVKIRGYRIELGEIEYALMSSPEIDQAVVLAKPNDRGEKELVAYVVSEVEQNSTNLREFLKEQLPDYMLPSYYVQLPLLPLNSNGKVDRKSLPSPEGLGLESGVEYVAPRTDLEKQLVTIWEVVLQREKIGVEDDFFFLGGHSLKAVRLINEYQRALSVKLSLKELFLHTTIRSHGTLIESSKSTEFVQIASVSEQRNYPISDAQRRLWVLSQFEEGSVAYNMPGSIYLNEEINIENFKKAVYATIGRHEILRTIFKEDESGDIKQWVLKANELNFEIDYYDYRSDKTGSLDSFMTQDAYQAFDLEKGPLLRAALLQLEDSGYVFYYNMHHIISDGWSMEVLSKDIVAFYNAYQSNETPNLAPLRIQYKDYSVWQLNQYKEENFQLHRSYWLEKLSGELPIIDLPRVKKRPRVKTYNGHTLSAQIDQNVTNKLKHYIQEKGGSLFMGLLGAWNVLMYRYTAQEDIIVGTPVAGREHPDLETQIGFYVNTLALRNSIHPTDSFDVFYQRLKQNTLENYSNQMYPFDRLVEDINLRIDTSRSAVFDTMISLQNLEGLNENEPLKSEQSSLIKDSGKAIAKFDLDITFTEFSDGLLVDVVYNLDVYERDMIKDLITHFKQLLTNLLDSPKEKIDDLDYLNAQERDKLLYQFNYPQQKYLSGQNLLSLFKEQVSKTPSYQAIIVGEMELTYSDLDVVSNQLSNYLIQKFKITSDDLIGVKLERSEWMLIVMIGILKTGAAYVPIDPTYPQDRIDFMIEDSRCKLVIDENELFNFKIQKNNYLQESRPIMIRESDLAYVIYTSGTTGRPKGVMITHESLMDYAVTFKTVFGLNSSDRVIQQSSISFDTHVEEMYPALISGSTILMSENGGKDIQEIEELVQKKKATILSATPLMLKELNDLNSDLTGLRLLISGGDKFTTSFVSNYLGKFQIYDSYGPTESTVCTTYAEIKNHDSRTIIGKPIQNRSVYILGKSNELQPIGAVGEICIGGVGLAKGYLNQPELTAECFVTNPFMPGSRMYKTGDLGRWLADGRIEFVGRQDDQVKIRGYRIELGEIEATLLKEQTIERAVVLKKQVNNEVEQLVAYIVCNQTIDTANIRAKLGMSLPDYMIPAHFVQLEAFPTTANGKLDKKGLPNPLEMEEVKRTNYAAPRTAAEIHWVEAWQTVLNQTEIGIDDDFFELGGNSIKAIQVSRMNDLHVPLKTIYQERTIRKCLAVIDEKENSELIETFKSELNEALNILLIPYAGATDIAYRKLAESLSLNYNAHIVSMPWHSLKDEANYQDHQWIEEKLMEEIKEKISGEIIVLGHSAGTSLALSLTHRLEAAKFPVLGLFQCAQTFLENYDYVPENKGGWSRHTDDQIWNDIILALGFHVGDVNDKTRRRIVNNLRHDAIVSEQIMIDLQTKRRNGQAKLKTPIHAIYGDSDPMTIQFERDLSGWSILSEKTSYTVIKNAGHYFVNTNVEETVVEINQIVAAWIGDDQN
jgi:amino acid adenylation domain-containing protein